MRWPSFSLLFSGIFVAYILHSIWTLAELFIPPACPVGERCIPSYLKNKPKLKLILFSSVKSSPTVQHDVNFLDSWPNFNYNTPTQKELNISVPSSTRNNGSLFLHLLLVSNSEKQTNFFTLHQKPDTVHTKIRLTQFHIPEASAFQLLGNVKGKKENVLENENRRYSQRPVTHMKSKVTFNILTDDVSFSFKSLPPEIARLLALNSKGEFLPVLQYDFLNNRLRDLVLVNSQDNVLQITLLYAPVTIGKLRLMQHVEAALRSLMAFGFTEKDVDEVKGIFADTNLYLLCITIFVAAVHLLFDFLAFKNDVSFWRRKENFAGLSSRSVIWRMFSQCVIFFYLLDEETSLLVLIPTGIGTIIEIWKTQKVIRVNLSFNKFYLPKIKFSLKGSSAEEQQTEKFDAESMKYLSYILYPLCIGGAIYSLLYEPHKSWYSWSIHSLVNGVYAFGFLFMLPQLFVNYKLKSVAHLPWRAFMYKAFNTFIDDLFAFIISMPVAHRVACFRDDIIFIIYLYQRWLYPVDKNRLDEAAVTHEEQIKKNE